MPTHIKALSRPGACYLSVRVIPLNGVIDREKKRQWAEAWNVPRDTTRACKKTNIVIVGIYTILVNITSFFLFL